MSNVSKLLLSNRNIITPTCLPFSSHFDIDTVRLFVSWLMLLDYDFEFLKTLIDAKETKIGYEGWYKSFRISYSEKGITITGSLSNYYKGYSDTLAHLELKNAIEKLGGELLLNLHLARLYRIDVNFNCITDKSVGNYTNHLFQYLSRFRRLEQADGVRFQTKSLAMEFYNKSKQIYEKKGLQVDDWFRIEFRIKKDVKKYLGICKMEDLYNVEKYHNLLDMFYKYYLSVRKQTVSANDIRLLKNPKEYERHLMLQGIIAKGGGKEVFREIEQLDKQDIFDNRNQKYRLIKKVNLLLAEKNLTVLHPLAIELNNKFEQAYKQEKLG